MGSVKSASFGGGEVNMKRIVTSAMIFDYNYLKEHEIEFE